MTKKPSKPAHAHPGARRHSHRGRSHAQAHRDAADHVRGPVPDHPLIPQGDPELITDPDALRELLAHAREEGRFAYDTEFIGELSYYPQICLVQVATPRRLALIDPLADLDLAPLWELLADPAVEKVVHAGLQDLEPVVRHLGRPPRHIFDTQVVAGLANLPYPMALAKLVQAYLGVTLGKGFTFTHWDERPLSERHQHYAADDVRYLLALREKLQETLAAQGHAAIAAEECRLFERPERYRPDPATLYERVRGAQGLKARDLAVLRELVIWRDKAAREHDLPPRTFLKDEILVRLAREEVRSDEQLERVRGVPRPVAEACASQIIEATLRALALPAKERPALSRVEESPAQRVAVDGLWAAATSLCLGQGIDPALVASRQEIAQLHQAASRGKPVDHLAVLQGWRGELLGHHLLRLLRGEEKLNLAWDHNRLKVSSDVSEEPENRPRAS